MKLFKPTLVAIALVSMVGCQQEAKQEEKAPVLDTEIQKQAYSLGASIGMYMTRNLAEQEKLGVSLSQDLIVRGFMDSLANKAVIEKEEIQSLLMSLDQTMKTKQQEHIKLAAEQSLAEGQKYLADNAQKEGVQVTESGLQYKVITEGSGAKPLATDTVKVHYTGTFLNGEVFDSSVERGEPAEFPLNRVISGWTEGVQLMNVGSKYKFTIPADLAYGPNGNPPRIPGNSVLEFEIELLEIHQAEAPQELAEQ